MSERGRPVRGVVRGPRPALALAAVALAIAGAIGPLAVPQVRAADDGLALTSSATYTLKPADGVVRVAVDVTAQNDKPNSVSGAITTRYFYDGFRIAVQPEARSVRASAAGRDLITSTKAAEGYRVLDVRFADSLFYHQATTVRVTFDLPGGAPRSASEVRVGSAFATFVAWAFGDVGSVRIVVPAGFDAEATGSDTDRGTVGGGTLFTASGIGDVANWSVVVNADRKNALTSARLDLGDGEHLLIRAWPEDRVWQRQVSQLLTRGLPELARRIGLAWPVANDLSVFEVHTPLLEGYGGVFFEGQNRIEISEDLDDLTILHEASHAWFNGNLFDGRWINEGLADTYAANSLEGIGISGFVPEPVSPTDKAAVPLVDWQHPGRINDAATEAREQYGYNAAWTVISTVVSEVGDGPMQRVLAAAQRHEIAYVGPGQPETVAGIADWRRLLDLLDERGGSKTADDLFRQFVVDAPLAKTLDERTAARIAYAALIQAGVDWGAPLYVRRPMSDWSFPEATTRIGEADAVLALRDRIVALAGSIGVPAPTDLRSVYQVATTTLDGATALAGRELAAGQELRVASAAVAAPRDPVVLLGLVGETPEAELAAARSAFSAGSPDAAAEAAAVSALIAGAGEVGRGRLFEAAAAVVILVIVLVILALLVRRRRRRLARRAALSGPASTLAVEPGGIPGWGATTIDGAAVRIGEGSGDGPSAGPPDGRPEPGLDAGWDRSAPYVTLADQSAGQPPTERQASQGASPDAASGDPAVDPPNASPTDTGDAS